MQILICVLVYQVPEKAMAPHSSTLAWKIPWMEEPGRLEASLEVGCHFLLQQGEVTTLN